MEITFNVHSVNTTKVATIGTVNGAEVRVMVDGLEVELVGPHGNATLRFMPPHVDAAKEIYKQDGQVKFVVAA